MIRKRLGLFVLLFVCFMVSSCQDQTKGDAEEFRNAEFDMVYTEIATRTSGVELDKALWRADSLLEASENDYQALKSWMLLATIKRRSGDLSEALAHAILASELAEKNRFYNWQVRISGFLSTTYREVGLLSEAREHLQRAELANERLKTSEGYYTVQLMIHQEKAYFLMEEDQDFHGAILELEKAQTCYDALPYDLPGMNVSKATTEQLLGLCYLNLKEFSLSESYYHKALETLGDLPSGLEPFIWHGLGDLMVDKKDYESAYTYYGKAEEAWRKSENHALNMELHKSLAAYYSAVDMDKKAFFHQKEYMALWKEKQEMSRGVSEEVVQLLKAEKENIYLLSRAYLTAIGILVFIVALILLLNRGDVVAKRNNPSSLPDNIFERIRQSAHSFRGNKGAEGNRLAISKETEQRILLQIRELEEKEYFLDRDLSMTSIASQMDTNPKYVAYLIQKYRNQNFTSYINGLRIRKAMEELRNNPRNLNYKIAYLAGEFGFSSHTSFTNAFKKVAGMSPSQFISQIKNKESNIYEV